MSSSKYKFLLDENVRDELHQFLKKENIDVSKVPKGLKNGKVAQLSLKEERILVTNDGDFASSSSKVFGLIWLRLAQNDAEGLLRAFAKLVAASYDLKGKFIIIKQDRVDIDELTNK